jgi:pilus assembly protein TadC
MHWEWVAAAASGLAVLSWRGQGAARLRPSGWWARLLHDGRPGRRRRLLLAAAMGASGAVFIVALGWWAAPIAVALGVLGYIVQGYLVSSATTRRRALLEAQLPQVCDLLAVCLDAGLPLRQATAVLADAVDAPFADALRGVRSLVELGAEEGQAWAELGAEDPPLAALGREVSRSIGSGVAVSKVLRSLGADARRDASARAQVRARRVGVRSVLPLMLCFLPAFLLLGVVPIIGGVAQHLLR